MDMESKLPTFSDKELSNLQANAERLQHSGSAKQQEQAAHLLPLINAESDSRKAVKVAALAEAKATRAEATKATKATKAAATKATKAAAAAEAAAD